MRYGLIETDSVFNNSNPARSRGLRPMVPMMAAHFESLTLLGFLFETISKAAPTMRRAQKMLR